MPHNDDDHLLYDYHEHHDPHHNPITHDHDQHPRHHHDHNGSITYLHEWLDPVDDDIAVPIARFFPAPGPLGAGGFDVSYRTARPAP